MARDILTAATRSAELTRKLLSFARRGQAQRSPVDVHTLVGEVCAVLRRSIDRRISVDTRLLAQSARVLGDPAELQNAVLNLARTAATSPSTASPARAAPSASSCRSRTTARACARPAWSGWWR